MRFLLLHGFAGGGASWRRFTELLPSDAEVLAPDLLGHGQSGALEDSGIVSFEQEVERIAELLEDRKANREGWHVVGYSLGGRVALGLALLLQSVRERQAGPSLERVTLVGVHPGLSEECERKARRLVDLRWAQVLEERGVDGFLEEWRELTLFASQRALSQDVLAAQRSVNQSHDPERLARAMGTLSLGRMPCYREQLEDIRVPLCWVAGALDGKFSGLGRECSLKSGSEFVAVENVGHNVVLEAPVELARIVLEGRV